jgi:hypothetical protein
MKPDAWFVEQKRRGRYQRSLQVAFWAMLTAWCFGFGVLLGRMVGD